MQVGYDRLIALGDRNTWRQYEVTAELTMNSLSCHDHTIGVVVGWQGHTTLQYGQLLPDQPRTGHPFPGLAQYYKGTPADTPKLNIWENTQTNPEFAIAEDTSGRQLQLGVKYIFKFRTTANATGGSHYSMKVWPASGTEPANWDLQADGDATQGSVVLGAHQGDISFGKITVTGL
jgi:hypothetical protein